MSIPLYVDKWLWKYRGLCYDDLSKKEQKKWYALWSKAPMEFLSYYGATTNSITIVRTDPIVYTKQKSIKSRRKLHNIPNDVKSGDLHRGGVWCDRHGCSHGTAYACIFHPPKIEP